MSNQPMDKLRALLLRPSLEYAARNSEFYRSHLGDHWENVNQPRDLHRLPLLTKAEAVVHQESMRCGESVTDLGVISSGTTRKDNELFWVQRCPEEDEALEQYFEMLPDSDDDEPSVLHVVSTNHGYPTEAPAHVRRLFWAPYPEVPKLIRAALTEPHNGQPITVLNISIAALRELTAQFVSDGTDFSEFSVKRIGTNGGYVSSRWRANVAQLWGAQVVDNYSLSEFRTSATECPSCGWYHFGAPPIVPEVLDVETNAPIGEGTGKLVLTSLYPYVQRTPLIRYVTGDLVEIGPVCEKVGDLGLRFRGRTHQTAYRGTPRGAEFLLLPIQLEDIADSYPWAARHGTIYGSLRGPSSPALVSSQPKFGFTYDSGKETITVQVGVTYNPRFFSDRCRSHVEELRGALLARHAVLDSWLQSGGTLVVELIGADERQPDWIVKHTA